MQNSYYVGCSLVCYKGDFNMTIREQIQEMEKETLSPYACLSANSRGRDREEPECDIRPVF